MSIWKYAVAGGLQGLGTSIATAEAERRERRGLALRESYLSGRLDKQLAARKTEADATRTQRAELAGIASGERIEQARLTREQRADIAGKAFTQREKIAQIASDERTAVRKDATIQSLLREVNKVTAQLSGTKRTDEVRKIAERIYTTYDEATGESVPNYELVSAAMGIWQDTGKMPDRIRISAQDLVNAVEAKENKLSFDEVVARHKALRFQVPNLAIGRARKDLEGRQSAEPAPTGTSTPTSRAPERQPTRSEHEKLVAEIQRLSQSESGKSGRALQQIQGRRISLEKQLEDRYSGSARDRLTREIQRLRQSERGKSGRALQQIRGMRIKLEKELAEAESVI